MSVRDWTIAFRVTAVYCSFIAMGAVKLLRSRACADTVSTRARTRRLRSSSSTWNDRAPSGCLDLAGHRRTARARHRGLGAESCRASCARAFCACSAGGVARTARVPSRRRAPSRTRHTASAHSISFRWTAGRCHRSIQSNISHSSCRSTPGAIAAGVRATRVMASGECIGGSNGRSGAV